MGTTGYQGTIMKEFFLMDGYAFFVWGSYAIVAAVLVLNVVAIKMQRRHILKHLRQLSEED